MTDIPQKVLDSYDFGEVQSQDRISEGLIHQTYKIVSNQGSFILQRLHPLLGTREIGEDFLAVTNHLAKKAFVAARAVVAKDGNVLVREGEYAWRMQTFINGQTYSQLTDPEVAKEAGRIYAQLHNALSDMEYEFQSGLKLHETEKIFASFQEIVQANVGSAFMSTVRDDVDFLLEELPKQILPNDLPQRVIHGDPKISNILFRDKKAVSVIDLDTCNRHTVLVDIGDAFRSWCGKGEDDPNNTFNLELFTAGWEGYKEGASFLTSRERELVPQAIGCITLELAARFLKDVFDDSYFGWDEKRYASRREHNLARARGQIALYKDFMSKIENVQAVVFQ